MLVRACVCLCVSETKGSRNAFRRESCGHFLPFFLLSTLRPVWKLWGFTQKTAIDFLCLMISSIFITVISSNTTIEKTHVIRLFTVLFFFFVCLHLPFSRNFFWVQCFSTLASVLSKWVPGWKERWRRISDGWGGGERSLNRAVCTVMPCSCAETRSLGELECELIGLTVCNQSWFIVH